MTLDHIRSIQSRDPAQPTMLEVILGYNGFHALLLRDVQVLKNPIPPISSNGKGAGFRVLFYLGSNRIRRAETLCSGLSDILLFPGKAMPTPLSVR